MDLLPNDSSDLFPSLVNVLSLVDVELRGVGAEITPDLVIGDHANLVTEVREGVLEGVQVGGRGAVD